VRLVLWGEGATAPSPRRWPGWRGSTWQSSTRRSSPCGQPSSASRALDSPPAHLSGQRVPDRTARQIAAEPPSVVHAICMSRRPALVASASISVVTPDVSGLVEVSALHACTEVPAHGARGSRDECVFRRGHAVVTDWSERPVIHRHRLARAGVEIPAHGYCVARGDTRQHGFDRTQDRPRRRWPVELAARADFGHLDDALFYGTAHPPGGRDESRCCRVAGREAACAECGVPGFTPLRRLRGRSAPPCAPFPTPPRYEGTAPLHPRYTQRADTCPYWAASDGPRRALELQKWHRTTRDGPTR
jgi:hypothetical protein